MSKDKPDISTQAGRWQHLLNGGKLKWGDGIVSLQNGRLADQNGLSSWSLADDDVWEIYEEPKPKKEVWEWLVTHVNGKSYIIPELYTEDEAKEHMPLSKLTKLRRFEVDCE